MKKVVLGLAVLATLSLTSCKKECEKQCAKEGETTEAKEEVPEFDNEKVGEYIELYDSYLEEYKEVVESKDMSKFQALTTKAQEFSEKAQAITAEGLSESDAKKLTDYMQEKAKEMQKLSQKMMQ